MYKITEQQYNKMPKELQALYKKLPNPSSDEVVGMFPDRVRQCSTVGEFDNTSSNKFSFTVGKQPKTNKIKGFKANYYGSAARFFYCAKASKAERNRGCEGLEEKQTTGGGGGIGNYLEDVNSASGKYGSEKASAKNNHPCVKPIALMEYLIKLVTTKDAIVLDPFAGSGTTLIACKKLGRDYIGIESEAEYVEIANKRLANTYYQEELIK